MSFDGLVLLFSCKNIGKTFIKQAIKQIIQPPPRFRPAVSFRRRPPGRGEKRARPGVIMPAGWDSNARSVG